MSASSYSRYRVAIACGGTGGHLFPGLAVAEKLRQRDCEVTLLVSPKDVDQQALKDAKDFSIVTLPAVGLKRGSEAAFLRGFGKSYYAARRLFKSHPPHAVLAMGGFTSAPPILAGRAARARTFLHESNTIPGRANRLLGWTVDQAFVGFSSATSRLKRCPVTISGTPVRSQFHVRDGASCRAELGFEPQRPVVLVVGGSQGASAINEMIIKALPNFARVAPEWQWLHLAGPKDLDRLEYAYAKYHLPAIVEPFLHRMELAMGAASAVISRAGASSLAELAAMRLPALLVPFPEAHDNHQWHNAQAFAGSGAAWFVEQKLATPELLVELMLHLVRNESVRMSMQAALALWERPRAAESIADNILELITTTNSRAADRAKTAPMHSAAPRQKEPATAC